MIRFTLKCREGHDFESWFQSSAAYEGLLKAGHVTCPDCGTTKVEKSLMAPMVRASRDAPDGGNSHLTPAKDSPQDLRAQALAKLKAEIEAKSEYVGMNFVAEARKMHVGDTPERAIYGPFCHAARSTKPTLWPADQRLNLPFKASANALEPPEDGGADCML